VALVRVPFYFINLWLAVNDSHFVHIYTTKREGTKPQARGGGAGREREGWRERESGEERYGGRERESARER
jgi:hypothetical protein